MKTDLDTIRESFEQWYEAYDDSYRRADEVVRMSKGKMYTQEQLSILRDRGQPAEHFNIIALFNRSLQGYFSSVVNTMHAKSVGTNNVETANTINLGIDYTLRMNDWEIMKDRIQISNYNAGIMNIGYKMVARGTDKYGRQKNEIELEYIPYYEIIRDPKSRKMDYSDSRGIHRFRWIHEDEMAILFPNYDTSKLNPFSNETGVESADFSYLYNDRFVGRFHISDEYLVVHSCIVNNKGVTEEVWWCGDNELKRQNLDFDSLKFPYRSLMLNPEDEEASFFGIYSDVSESQKAINQALLQIQMLANGSKVLVENQSVEDLEEFETQWARVNSVIPIAKLAGVQVIEFSRDIANQYMIIDKALSRIQQVLHVNDAFLGQAYSQDSGKKVALQKNSAMMALRYLGVSFDMMYRYIGLDIIYLMRQYMTAEVEIENERSTGLEGEWKSINTPMMDETTGQPMSMTTLNQQGKLEKELINDPTTSFIFDRMDLKIESIPYDTDDSADKLMLEQTIAGPAGNLLMNANPGEFLKTVSLLTREYRTKNSSKVADQLDMIAQKMGALPWKDPREVAAGAPPPPGGVQPQQATGAQNIGSVMGLDNNITNK